MNLLIIGAGNFAKDIERIAQLQGYDDIAYLDDNKASAQCFPVIGTMDEIESFVGRYNNAIVAIGNNLMRMDYLKRLGGYQIPTLIHPSAQISKEAKLGIGCIVKASAVVNSNACVGNGVVLNDGAAIGQGCTVGDGCSFLPYASISNMAEIEPCCWVDSYTDVV